MKVLHVCLAAFYIDDFGYQENILPRIHKGLGFDVEVVASTETYLNRVQLKYTEPSTYLSSDLLRITRLPYVNWLPSKLARKLRIYSGLKQKLESFKPDILFLHDCQFLSIKQITDYAKKNKVTVYVDCHTDLINSGRSFFSRHLLHGLIYKWCAKHVGKVTKFFYATLPLRANFLQDVYGILPEKIRLLPFGVDDTRIIYNDKKSIREKTRSKLGILDDELVFVTGGKIDERKNIHLLVEAFIKLSERSQLPNTKLILFGEPDPKIELFIQNAIKHSSIVYVGWIPANLTYHYLWAADIAIFPGTHSVLWEESVGLGVACVFRRWEGIEHVDLGGNCLFLDDVTVGKLETMLLDIHQDRKKLRDLKAVASLLGPKTFSYSQIGRYSLEIS